MPSLKRAFNYLLHNRMQFLDSCVRNLGFVLGDKLYLSLRFRCIMGKWIDWKNPQTFSEKLQWLKLYNRDPEYSQMVDKYAVKAYVSEILGKEYVIPSLALWDKVEDIDWESLPEKFVLKTTHGGGSTGVVICRDKTTFDKDKAIKKLKDSLKHDIYRDLREWPYKNVLHRIIAEDYIDPTPGEKDLPDYKFFCFNGEPKYCQVISGRGSKMSIDFFDYDWNHQPFHEPQCYPFAINQPLKPSKFDKMWDAARKLAQNKPFSRIDFYATEDHVYFGEITFFPTSGMGGFEPNEWDSKFGEWIDLSSCTRN